MPMYFDTSDQTFQSAAGPNRVELTNSEYGGLLDGRGRGKLIVVDSVSGRPTLVDPPTPEIYAAQVDFERDRRIASGFTHAGKVYDSNPESMRRIDKAYAVACRALVEGAKAGNLRWADAAQDFRWIAKDNSYVTMDAPTVVTFGEAAAAWETKHIYKARELKSMSPIPTDYTDEKYWS